jgi:hypothetical protein
MAGTLDANGHATETTVPTVLAGVRALADAVRTARLTA